MSDRHKEALAHLTYGLGETGGFALLTGEVGTGKTTISRCLMEQLPDNTQAAFILNPTLSSRELLATLCDELKIRYRKSDASLKTLTDKISEKLLKNHENDINTLLIIDEAQHLQPEVLEQLRLLTNLETNTKKLLQVILIGQPELQQLLQRRDLRQLAQRITARYHLMPLTKQELSQYVAHRLAIADCTRTLFTPSAISKIHQLSGGIPRLINLICHSALMIAYNQNDSLVNKKIIFKSAEHALGTEQQNLKHSNRYQPTNNILLKITATFSLVAIVSVVALSAFLWGQNTSEQQSPVVIVKPQETVIESENIAAEAVITEQPVEITPKEAAQEKLRQKEKVNEQLQISSNKPSANNPVIQDQATAPQDEFVALKVTDLDDVSEELLSLFQTAVDETTSEANNKTPNNESSTESNNLIADSFTNKQVQVESLTKMPVWVQNGVPSLTFEQHIYSSDGRGWINVNGRDRYEGDMITSDLEVSKILPQQVILIYRGETFSLPALTNW